MKKLLLITALGLMTCALLAQTDKGNVAFGLHNFSPAATGTSLLAPTNLFGISFGKIVFEQDGHKMDEAKYTSFGLSGSVHYFIIDGLSGGANLNVLFQNVKEQSDYGDEYSMTIVMAGPEVRYYFNLSERVKVFVKGSASFGTSQTEYNGNSDDKVNLSQYGMSGGIALFLNEHIGLDLGLGYSVLRQKYPAGDFFGEYYYNIGGVIAEVGFTAFLNGSSY